MDVLASSNLKRKFFALLFFTLVSFSLFAVSLDGVGYGKTLNEAKANALQDLLSRISVNVSSSLVTKNVDSSDGYQQSLSKDVIMSSDFTLEFVRYDVSESETKEEKASGKYKCIASITDEDKALCLAKVNSLVFEIDSIYEALLKETNLRAKKVYCDALLSRLSSYNSCLITARLLGYQDEMSVHSFAISYELIEVEDLRLQEELLRKGLSGEISDTTTEGLEEKLLNNLWNNKANVPSSTNVKTSYGEGVYSKDYKVGDFGPAGGIVFYDKGEFSDGWRYLEVSSEAIKGTYAYGKSGTINTKKGLGEGKSNTKAIIELNDSSSSYAALACSSYEGGGYTDWYLPSEEELEMIYKKVKNNKNFSYEKAGYWSSSQLNKSYAIGFSFKTKKTFSDTRATKYRVLAIRSF